MMNSRSKLPGQQSALSTLIKYKWIAAVAGVLLASFPVLFLTVWLNNLGEPEVSIEAKASIRIADLLIDEAVTSFNELDARGVGSCGASDVRIMQRVSFASQSLRELAVVDRNGQTLCTDRGGVFAAREMIASAATSNPEIMLDVVRTAESNERMLRVRRVAAPGKAD